MTKYFAVLAALSLAACVNTPQKVSEDTAPDPYACNFLPETPAPAWVNDDGLQAAPGYFYGKGSASRATSMAEQTQMSKNSSLKALAQSIQVSVQSSQTSNLIVRRKDNQETFSHEVQDTLQVSSNLTLNKVEPAGQWLDRKNCMLWTRLRISESSLLHERLRALVDSLKNPALPLAERRDTLNSGEALLAKIDFSRVPDSEGHEFYRKLLANEQKAVSALDHDAVAIFLIDQNLPAGLARELLARLPGGRQFVLLENVDCNVLEACVNLARRHGANRLLFGRLSQRNEPSKMGGRTSQLDAELTLADTRSGKAEWGPNRLSERLLTFGEFTDADWFEALHKIAESETLQPIALCLATTEMKTCS